MGVVAGRSRDSRGMDAGGSREGRGRLGRAGLGEGWCVIVVWGRGE